jgi:hypothetical protein
MVNGEQSISMASVTQTGGVLQLYDNALLRVDTLTLNGTFNATLTASIVILSSATIERGGIAHWSNVTLVGAINNGIQPPNSARQCRVPALHYDQC